jgi:hypothetical protein
MSATLKDFVGHLLARHGALVEEVGHDSLEALFPPGLAAQLGVGELERFSFPEVSREEIPSTPSPGPVGPPARVVGYQSEFLEALGELVAGRGSWAAAALAESLPLKRLELERDIERTLVLQNAVIRGQHQEPALGSYLVFHFKYSALSDERHEGMVSVAINEQTLTVAEGLAELVPQLTLSPTLPLNVPRTDFERLYTRARRAAQSLIQDALADFIRSMNRRLNRDCRRITEYYRTIQQEIETKIKKKRLTGEEMEREQSRIHATEVELERKIRDLQTKYGLTVRAEVVGGLRLFLPVMLVQVRVMRRKWMVPISLAWNPVLRELERATCLGCFRPSKRIFICDDQRHIVCPECFTLCPTCQRPWCRACTSRGCPRCQPTR